MQDNYRYMEHAYLTAKSLEQEAMPTALEIMTGVFLLKLLDHIYWQNTV